MRAHAVVLSALCVAIALTLSAPGPSRQGSCFSPWALFASTAHAMVPATTRRELRGHVDWQGHPAMHMLYPMFFRPGLRDEAPTNLTWNHTFEQQVYAPFLRHSGVRVFGAAAMAAEQAKNPGQAHALIDEQLEFVEQFASAHSDGFVLARTPSELRDAVNDSHKMVFVHQIEGGRMLLLDPRDAWYWRTRGVMLVTVMHLLDDALGHAASNLGPEGPLLNLFFNGINFHPGQRRGLTPRGRDAIVELARAGIMVDLAHMPADAVDDALAVCRAHGIPPIVTHGMYGAIQQSDRGLTAAQIIEIYRLGGMLSIPVAGNSLNPRNPTIPIPAGLVPGTMDMFRFHVETLHRLLRDNATTILGRPWEQLTDAERTRLAVGWASDWNGWTVHSTPTPSRAVRGATLEIDRVGLAHPGLLPQYWQRLREDGMDLDPLERSLERFVQIWESVRAGAHRTR